MTRPVDYDLHGLVGIRLVDATIQDAAVVTRQLGPVQSPLEREPDIVIRFVDRLVTTGPVRFLGLNDAAFTDDAFLILRSKHKSQARAQIPLGQVGRPCELVCERGLPAVPLLIAIINLTMLGKGVLPLHASAFTYGDVGVVVAGWAKGGKTEALLAFMNRGARYVGDEWVYFTADGRRMLGIPEPMRVWAWHLRELAQYRQRLGRGEQIRLQSLDFLVNILERMAAVSPGRGPARLIRRVTSLLQRQQYVHLPPHRLFGDDHCVLTGRPDKFFMVISHDRPEIAVEPLPAQEIARRMAFCLQEEQRELWSAYRKFRFAFPSAANEVMEGAEISQRQLLDSVLARKETYAVYHPYPVSIPALFEAIRPYCGARRAEAGSDIALEWQPVAAASGGM